MPDSFCQVRVHRPSEEVCDLRVHLINRNQFALLSLLPALSERQASEATEKACGKFASIFLDQYGAIFVS